MKHLLDLALDALGLIRRSEFDERIAELTVAVCSLACDTSDLAARVDEWVGVKPVEQKA